MTTNETNYMTYRGKCKEYTEAFVKTHPNYRIVRGHYICPYWGEQEHWWTVDEDGYVFDPTLLQFPSKGSGKYVEFGGILHCAECGKEMHEDDKTVIFHGNYCFCSPKCARSFVGC